MTSPLAQQDHHQRQQALNASESFIVQAPAGSGKTTLLIQRFLTLLNHVKAPEEILAITFTKKAANEMRVRVISALKNALSETAPESDHAKQTWVLAKKVLERDQKLQWNILGNPNQLRIQTIDSLCAYLTRQLPLLSHLGAVPDISDTPHLLYQEAVQEVLAHVESDFNWSLSIAKLLLHLDNDLNKLHDLLIHLLSKRDQWLPYIHLNADDLEIKKQLECHLRAVIIDNLQSLYEIFPKNLINEVCSIACFAANHITKPESNILYCKDIASLPGIEPCDLQAWKGLATLLLTEEGSWRKQFNISVGFPSPTSVKHPGEKSVFTEYKQRAAELITQLYDNEKLKLALSNLSLLPDEKYHENQWEILRALLQVLKITAAQLRVTFQLYGQIDFIENTQAAITALGNDDNPTDLALALDYQIKHILVDEFQDTSFTQYHLLEKLISGWEPDDGRTLFIVGDPMQSIYRFREAEVGLFIRMRLHGIGQLKLIPLTLAINFRSTPSIIEWNNRHFGSIFPAVNDTATGAVTYSHSVSNDHFTKEADSTINVSGFVDVTSLSQSQHIVSIIQHCKKNNPTERIAILVRARQHLKDIIPALKKAHIPYRAVEIDALAEKQPILDLLSLTRALLHPADHIAWFAILRAPWCGLTLADLLVLTDNKPYTVLSEQWERQEILAQLSSDGLHRLLRIRGILQTKIAERDRCDIRTWVESTWLALGGPACLHDLTDMQDINAFFTLLEECGQHNEPLSIRKLEIKIEKLFATPQHDESAVQIMTIHSAKGLEFDTVILPHLERKKATDSSPLLLWMEYPLANDHAALLMAPIHATGRQKDSIYQFIHHQQQIKLEYETDRLLYVATTRAKQRLHLLFNTSKNNNDTYAVESGSFLKKLWPFFKNDLDHVICSEQSTEDNTSRNEKRPRYTVRVVTDWINPFTEPSIDRITTHIKSGGFQMMNQQPKLIGTLVHHMLQHLADVGISWWESQNQETQRHYIKQHLIQLGMLPIELESSSIFVHRMLHHVCQDPRGLWILQPHREAKSEFALSAVINSTVENIVIDRTFIDENNIRWIIDYKTTFYEDGDLELFLAKEQKRYEEKMHLYAKAISLIDEKPIRLGLYFPAIPAWTEWSI